MKNAYSLVVASFLFLRASSTVFGGTHSVWVYGLFDTDNTGQNLVGTDGSQTVHAYAAFAYVDYNIWGTYEYVWNPDTQTYDYVYVEHQDPISGTERTQYHINLPDPWTGRSVAFSWGGGTFTGYQPMVSSYGTFNFNVSDSGGNGTLPGQQNPQADADLFSNRLLIGKWWDNPSHSLLTFQTWDNVDPYWPSMGMDLIATKANAFWRWMHPSDDGLTARIAMDLDHEHRLTLRGRGNDSSRLTLDPNNGTISVNGESFLTAPLARAEFVSRYASNFNIGSGAISSGQYSLALGSGAQSTGNPFAFFSNSEMYGYGASTAVGQYAYALDRGTVSVGALSRATEDLAVAIGMNAKATGMQSIAVGNAAQAKAYAASAYGPFATAEAPQSLSLGYRTTAKGYGQTVVGVNNVLVGNAADPADSNSEVFVVGAGSYEWSSPTQFLSVPRNVFTVKRGGDAAVTGSLKVNGTGESRISGKLRVDGRVRITPQGDISMGEFTAEPAN